VRNLLCAVVSAPESQTVSRPTKVPAYRKHKATGQAVVTLPGRGRRRDVFLGKFGTPESQKEYARVIAEWVGTAAGFASGSTADTTVNELVMAFWKHAVIYYRRRDGQPTSEQHNDRAVIRNLRVLYGHTPVADFGPAALKALRQQWITAAIVRAQVNARTYRVRRIFRWGVPEELVPPAVADALFHLEGLRSGRTEAAETSPVRPVSDEMVAAVMPFLPEVVRDMVTVQRLTGMRPGEVCAMTWEEVDRSGSVWYCRPTQHKTAHRGIERVVAIGPRAQEILSRYLSAGQCGYVFSPKESERARRQTRAASRKTPRYPSHMRRNEHKRQSDPRWCPGEGYTEAAYRRAISRACEQAWPPPEPLRPRSIDRKGERVSESRWPSGKHGWASAASPNCLFGKRNIVGRLTNSDTPPAPRCERRSGPRRRGPCSATWTSRRPRSTPNGTWGWRRAWRRRLADGCFCPCGGKRISRLGYGLLRLL
jgi:integrase